LFRSRCSPQCGRGAPEQRLSSDSARFLPRLHRVDHVVHRAQQGDRGWITGRIGIGGAAHPMVDPLMREGGETLGSGDAARAVRTRGVAVGLFDPGGGVGMRQVMDAHAILGREGHHFIGMTLHPGMDGTTKGNGAAAEQANMVLRPVIGALIMSTQDIVTQRKCVDIGARPLQFRPDPASGLLVQALVVVQKQDPVVTAQRKREGARVLDRRGPGNRNDLMCVAGGHRAGIIGRGFVDDDHLIGKSERLQAGLQYLRPVIGNDEGTDFRFGHGTCIAVWSAGRYARLVKERLTQAASSL
jgi:hypothetical protein